MTKFALSSASLVAALAGQLLRQSEDYQALIRAIGAKPGQ